MCEMGWRSQCGTESNPEKENLSQQTVVRSVQSSVRFKQAKEYKSMQYLGDCYNTDAKKLSYKYCWMFLAPGYATVNTMRGNDNLHLRSFMRQKRQPDIQCSDTFHCLSCIRGRVGDTSRRRGGVSDKRRRSMILSEMVYVRKRALTHLNSANETSRLLSKRVHPLILTHTQSNLSHCTHELQKGISVSHAVLVQCWPLLLYFY